jgi:signal transduction histidine kinase
VLTRASAPAELRRPLTLATALVWAAVTAPVVAQISGARSTVIAGWGLLAVTFLAAALASLRATRRATRLGLLAVGTGAIVGTVALACDGFEGALLVLIALQLGGLIPRRWGVVWVALQSILVGLAIGWHWNARSALLLTPPYCGFQLLALFMADLVTTATAARCELARANAELSATQGVVAEHTRLAERVRIARELHDAVGHQLTALSMHLEVAGKLAPGDAASEVAVARELARTSLADIRDVVDRLRDDERVDVLSALRTLADETIAPRVHVRAPHDLCRDDPQRALAILRCTQEIVTNARRHSRAENLWLDVAVSGSALEVSARDDGVGADSLRFGNGLRGMRERIEAAGGRLSVSTARGRGFELHAVLPDRRS